MNDAIPVGVFDPVPAYCRGLMTALLDSGFDARAVEDPVTWAGTGGQRVVVVSASLPREVSAIRRLVAAGPDTSVVVLLREATTAAFREALAAGADGAVPWSAPTDTVIEVLQAAITGHCLLPAGVARSLATLNGGGRDAPLVSEREAKWLQLLAEGAPIAELARQANYSERETFRLLNRLYERLGARNRAEALVNAARAGLLERTSA